MRSLQTINILEEKAMVDMLCTDYQHLGLVPWGKLWHFPLDLIPGGTLCHSPWVWGSGAFDIAMLESTAHFDPGLYFLRAPCTSYRISSPASTEYYRIMNDFLLICLLLTGLFWGSANPVQCEVGVCSSWYMYSCFWIVNRINIFFFLYVHIFLVKVSVITRTKL